MRTAGWLDNKAHGEDRLLRRKGLIAVMDGVSTANGAVAANTLKNALKRTRTTPDAVKATIQNVHERLKKKYEGTTQTTIVACLPEHKIIFHVGDSLAYSINEHAKLLTKPDNTAEPNVLTQAIGVDDIVIHETPYAQERFLMLMSDGIGDNLSPEELAKATRKTTRTRTIKARIKKLLKQKQKLNQGYTYTDYKDDDYALIILL